MPGRILSVEDDPDTAEMLAAALELSGYEVVTAGHARGALNLLLTEPFDLLITDYMLPENDGAWLIRNARAAGRALPAVLCTAHPSPPDLVGVRVVAKPLDLERFMLEIATLIEESAAVGLQPAGSMARANRMLIEARALGDALAKRSSEQIARAHSLCAKSKFLCARLAIHMANFRDSPTLRHAWSSRQSALPALTGR
jgi:CheY-like chemotaxis protein